MNLPRKQKRRVKVQVGDVVMAGEGRYNRDVTAGQVVQVLDKDRVIVRTVTPHDGEEIDLLVYTRKFDPNSNSDRPKILRVLIRDKPLPEPKSKRQKSKPKTVLKIRTPEHLAEAIAAPENKHKDVEFDFSEFTPAAQQAALEVRDALSDDGVSD